MQCCFDHQPALYPICVLHLHHIVTQIFSSHGHYTVLTLVSGQGRKKKESNQNKIQQESLTLLREQQQQMYLVTDGDGAKAVEKEQQGRVDVFEQVPGLMALGTQGETDFRCPADEKTV